VKLQILSLGAKLFVASPDKTRLLVRARVRVCVMTSCHVRPCVRAAI
jgi:hypothetical protein